MSAPSDTLVVLRGEPTDAEVAALVVALARCPAPEPESARPPRPGWIRHETPNPAAWTQAAVDLPRG